MSLEVHLEVVVERGGRRRVEVDGRIAPQQIRREQGQPLHVVGGGIEGRQRW